MASDSNLSHVFGQEENPPESWTVLVFIGVASIAILLLRSLYRFALPKPFPGIPYNEASAHRLLGDVPDVISHIKNTDGTFITYLKESMIKLNAPLIQVFIRPLSTPLLILADFREAHDLLITRKEFDRSPSLSDLVKGLVPEHHIHLPTEGGWRGQRRLVQDLMGPSFLHNVAGPVIYQRVELMIDLWHSKCRIAEGRPFQANEDINHVSLDAVLAFTYGEDFEHGMTKPNFEAVKNLDSKDIDKLRSCTDPKTPIEFPEGKLDEVIQATVDLTETVGEIQGKPIPALTRTLVSLRPGVRRATKIKEEYVTKELRGAVKRLHEAGTGEDVVIKSAVDHLVMKERSFAEKEQRKPDYFSRIMIDEVG